MNTDDLYARRLRQLKWGILTLLTPLLAAVQARNCFAWCVPLGQGLAFRWRKQLEREIAERKRAEEDLARFNRLAVGREKRMIELKRQVNELSEELGREPPYDVSFVE